MVEGDGLLTMRMSCILNLVTDPLPTKTGMGTSRVTFFSPVMTPVPVIPLGFEFLCPSLGVTRRVLPLLATLKLVFDVRRRASPSSSCHRACRDWELVSIIK